MLFLFTALILKALRNITKLMEKKTRCTFIMKIYVFINMYIIAFTRGMFKIHYLFRFKVRKSKDF